MGRHVIRKGIKYFKKNGIKKALKRTVYFFMDKKSYGKLMDANKLSKDERAKQRKESFAVSPKISIIIPMFHTPEKFFKELIHSIMNQTYTNWELCLADGSGSETEAAVYIKELISSNEFALERIKYKLLESNEGISGNTNGALDMATGEFVALVDHDDIITEDALYQIVKTLNNNPLSDSIYSDEDKMDYAGKKFFEPHFKPDFNIDYLRSGNYICHLFVTRTSIAKEIGGFRKEFDGAQDFDFIFRCTEKSRQITHIPRVLYHWRCHPESTAARPESKMYAYEAGIKTLQEHYKRMGMNAEVQMGDSFGYYKSRFGIVGNPHVTIISASGCNLNIIEKITYENKKIIEVEKYSPTCLNTAVRQAESDYILFVNPHTSGISANVIQKLLGYVQRNDVAMAAARTDGLDKKVYHAGIVIGMRGSFGYAFRGLDKDNNGYFMRLKYPQDVSAVDMSCTLVKKEVFLQANGFNENMENMDEMYWSTDFCLNIEELFQENGKIVLNPYARATINQTLSGEDAMHNTRMEDAFIQKWKKRIVLGDKYYNTNLSKKHTDFSILSWAEIKERK